MGTSVVWRRSCVNRMADEVTLCSSIWPLSIGTNIFCRICPELRSTFSKRTIPIWFTLNGTMRGNDGWLQLFTTRIYETIGLVCRLRMLHVFMKTSFWTCFYSSSFILVWKMFLRYLMKWIPTDIHIYLDNNNI